MMFTIQANTSITWAEPIEMLYACHGRVKNFCHQLRILPAYLATHGVNQAVKNDVQQILNYFNRSEEHTSELQSRQYLVCRLLLEKKKKNKYQFCIAVHGTYNNLKTH